MAVFKFKWQLTSYLILREGNKDWLWIIRDQNLQIFIHSLINLFTCLFTHFTISFSPHGIYTLVEETDKQEAPVRDVYRPEGEDVALRTKEVWFKQKEEQMQRVTTGNEAGLLD